jgi:hypothetical protein
MSDAATRRWATGVAIGSVATLVVTAAVLFLAVRRPSDPAYATGQRVDLPVALYSGAARTLIVVSRSTCGGCQTSKPFLSRLVAEMRRVDRARVALVVEHSSEAEQAFATEIGVASAEVVELDVTRFKVRRVPTVLVVDAGGAIRFSHEDAPVPGEQDALLARYRDALRRP